MIASHAPVGKEEAVEEAAPAPLAEPVDGWEDILGPGSEESGGALGSVEAAEPGGSRLIAEPESVLDPVVVCTPAAGFDAT